MWESAASASDITRVVLVQPSIYGNDNRALVRALHKSSRVHRGVAVIDGQTSNAQLNAMHTLGVRGARYNLVSPVGNALDEIDATVDRIRALGWHLQFYLTPKHYAWLLARQRAWRVPVVLDHMAGLTLTSTVADLQLLCALGDGGAWIKFSGYYRLGFTPPFDAVGGIIQLLTPQFAGRMLWGSDAPHSWFMEPGRENLAKPSYADLLGALTSNASAALQQSILCDAPAALYG